MQISVPLVNAKVGKPVPAEYEMETKASEGVLVNAVPKLKHEGVFRTNSNSNEDWVGVNDVARTAITAKE
jgi:hypothetical protein